MAKCYNCGKELEDIMKEEGYETVFRCHNCGALNSVRGEE